MLAREYPRFLNVLSNLDGIGGYIEFPRVLPIGDMFWAMEALRYRWDSITQLFAIGVST
jgi:hypothetical protein